MNNKKNQAVLAKKLWDKGLSVGDFVELSVTDRNAFFAESVDVREEGVLNMEWRYVFSEETVALTRREKWTGTIKKIERTGKTREVKGETHQVVKVTVSGLKRVERMRTYFSEGILIQEIWSGGSFVSKNSVPAERKSHRMRFNDKIYNVDEFRTDGRIITRFISGPLDKDRVINPNSPFPELNPGQFDAARDKRFFIAPKNWKAPQAQAA